MFNGVTVHKGMFKIRRVDLSGVIALKLETTNPHVRLQRSVVLWLTTTNTWVPAEHLREDDVRLAVLSRKYILPRNGAERAMRLLIKPEYTNDITQSRY